MRYQYNHSRGAIRGLVLALGVLLPCSALAQQQRPSPASRAPVESVDELLERLHESAHSYAQIVLPYSASMAGRVDGEPPQWEESGEVHLDDWRLSVRMSHEARGGSAKWYEATWDGVEGVVRSGPGRSRDAGAEGLQSLTKDESWGRFPLSSSYLPHNFGISIGHSPLGKYLESSVADVRILGRRTVLGVDCVEVLFDMDGRSGDDGEYASPWVLAIDDRDTLLALVIQNHVRRKSLERRGVPDARIDELEVEIGGGAWVPYERFGVLSHDRARGVPVCTHAELECHELFGRPKISVRVDVDAVRLGESLPRTESITPDTPTRVHDNVRGDDYFLLPDGSKHPHLDVQFRSLLQGYAENRGFDLRSAELESPILWGNSSCGPDAIYFAGHVLGTSPRLEDLIAQVPDHEGRVNVTSLDTLGKLARSAGLEFLVVETGDPAALDAFDGVIIVHQAGQGDEKGHFGVVDFKGQPGLASIISPPHSTQSMTPEELLGGSEVAYFMLLADDASMLEPFIDRASPRRARTAAMVIVAVVLGLLGLRVLRRRRGAIKLNVVAVLLLIGVVGCKPSPASAESPGPDSMRGDAEVAAPRDVAEVPEPPSIKSVLLGPMSHDLGEVDPGKTMSVALEWMHVGDKSVSFRADRASCQCTRFQFLDQDVAPGEIARAEIRAAAPLNEGPFQIVGNFEEIHADGRTVNGSVVLFGTVPHRVFTYVEPDALAAVRDATDEGAVQLETSIIATCRSRSTLPEDVECLDLPPGVSLELGAPKDETDDAKGVIRRWSAVLSIDTSDDRVRGEMDRLRFVFSDDRRVGANLMLEWSRRHGYPLESKSAVLQRAADEPLSHRVRVTTTAPLELLHVPDGLECVTVEGDEGTILHVTEVDQEARRAMHQAIVLRAGEDWPVSYSLVQHAAD